MVDITKLNIKYVDDNGFYSDYDKGVFLRLNDKEIIELRRYHNNRLSHSAVIFFVHTE